MKVAYVGDCNAEGIRLQGKNGAKGRFPHGRPVTGPRWRQGVDR